MALSQNPFAEGSSLFSESLKSTFLASLSTLRTRFSSNSSVSPITQ